MRILIETVPHEEQRYNTPGDWFITWSPHSWIPSTLGHGNRQCRWCSTADPRNSGYQGGGFNPQCESAPSTLYIRISQEIHDISKNFAYLMALHELVEALLCIQAEISDKDVDRFDLKWKPRRLSDGTRIEEPGADPRAPYHQQHMQAECIERAFAEFLHVHWPSYGNIIESVCAHWKGKISP